MRFTKLTLEGAYIVELEPRADERGWFSRFFCEQEFANHGIEYRVRQINNSLSVAAGTLRGLHYQVAPHGDAKLVRCLSGAAFDVILDMRETSATYGKWHGAELTAENRKMMFVPQGFAHGFLTLEDNTEMLYPASQPYAGISERVIRWNDPRFAIEWPRQPSVVSEKDANAPDFNIARHISGY